MSKPWPELLQASLLDGAGCLGPFPSGHFLQVSSAPLSVLLHCFRRALATGVLKSLHLLHPDPTLPLQRSKHQWGHGS